MESLIATIKKSLTEIADNLFMDGRGKATQKLNDAFEELAFSYADGAGLAFGTHYNTHPLSQNKDSDKRILVCREEGRKYNDRDVQGRFLLDHCWLVYYNDKASGDCVGRLVGCELIMESEWNLDSEDPDPEFKFLYDFRKLLITNARTKVFVFQSKSANSQEATFLKLQEEIKTFKAYGNPVNTYLLCGWLSNTFHYVSASG